MLVTNETSTASVPSPSNEANPSRQNAIGIGIGIGDLWTTRIESILNATAAPEDEDEDASARSGGGGNVPRGARRDRRRVTVNGPCPFVALQMQRSSPNQQPSTAAEPSPPSAKVGPARRPKFVAPIETDKYNIPLHPTARASVSAPGSLDRKTSEEKPAAAMGVARRRAPRRASFHGPAAFAALLLEKNVDNINRDRRAYSPSNDRGVERVEVVESLPAAAAVGDFSQKRSNEVGGTRQRPRGGRRATIDHCPCQMESLLSAYKAAADNKVVADSFAGSRRHAAAEFAQDSDDETVKAAAARRSRANARALEGRNGNLISKKLNNGRRRQRARRATVDCPPHVMEDLQSAYKAAADRKVRPLPDRSRGGDHAPGATVGGAGRSGGRGGDAAAAMRKKTGNDEGRQRRRRPARRATIDCPKENLMRSFKKEADSKVSPFWLEGDDDVADPSVRTVGDPPSSGRSPKSGDGRGSSWRKLNNREDVSLNVSERTCFTTLTNESLSVMSSLISEAVNNPGSPSSSSSRSRGNSSGSRFDHEVGRSAQPSGGRPRRRCSTSGLPSETMSWMSNNDNGRGTSSPRRVGPALETSRRTSSSRTFVVDGEKSNRAKRQQQQSRPEGRRPRGANDAGGHRDGAGSASPRSRRDSASKSTNASAAADVGRRSDASLLRDVYEDNPDAFGDRALRRRKPRVGTVVHASREGGGRLDESVSSLDESTCCSRATVSWRNGCDAGGGNASSFRSPVCVSDMEGPGWEAVAAADREGCFEEGDGRSEGASRRGKSGAARSRF